MGMNENLKTRKEGYKQALDDIERMGIEWAKSTFVVRLKCTWLDAWFTVGYGEAIVYQAMRDEAKS